MRHSAISLIMIIGCIGGQLGSLVNTPAFGQAQPGTTRPAASADRVTEAVIEANTFVSVVETLEDVDLNSIEAPTQEEFTDFFNNRPSTAPATRQPIPDEVY